MITTAVSKGSEIIFNHVLKNLIEENPLFMLKSCGYEGYIHQAELFYKLAVRHPIRALIADEIGLGKTIETLLLIKWGLSKGKFSRVLILVPRGILMQWKMEAKNMKLNPIIDINQLKPESDGSKRIFIFKIDTVKQEENKEKLLKYEWDVIVVDEVHKLGLNTDRYKLVKELVEKNPNASIIFLSATPHRGKEDHYVGLLSLLDNLNEKNVKKLGSEFYAKTIDAIVFRRSKKEVNEIYKKEKIFVDAKLEILDVKTSDEDKIYIDMLDELTRQLIKKCPNENLRNAVGLLACIINKRGLSSPKSGWETFNRILERIKTSVTSKAYKNYEDLEFEEDIDATYKELLEEDMEKESIRNFIRSFGAYFEKLKDLAFKNQEKDSKLEYLKKVLLYHLDKGEKVIVFTEFADTANYIYDKLKDKLNYKIEKITGEDDETKIEKIKDWLKEEEPRVLISTDVASYGLNLQYANIVINYELPWSLVTLEQRVGRVWRLGQRKDVKIYLMVLDHGFERIIFDAFYQKLAEAAKRAMVAPSILIAIENREKQALPISGISTPSFNDLYYKYVTSYEEFGKLFTEYLNQLKEYVELEKKLYKKSYSSFGILEVAGFINRKDFNDFLFKVASKLGKPCYNEKQEKSIKEMLTELFNYKTFPEPLCLSCGKINEPIIVLKACVALATDKSEVCWFYIYQNGRILPIKELVDVIGNFDNYEEMGMGFKDSVLKYYDSFIKKIKTNVFNELKKNLTYILGNHFEYLEFAKERNLQKGMLIMKPIKEEDIKISIAPLMIIIPKEVGENIKKSLMNEIEKAIGESITIGEITEEKLEVEEKGIKVLENVLNKKYELLYVGNTKAPFDFIARKRSRNEEIVFIELKTLEKYKFIIYTENEMKFAEKVKDFGYEYWLYVVDLADKEIRGYLNLFVKGKLRLFKVKEINNKKYFVYEEMIADERFQLNNFVT
jgi:superfamily II DNA or RNA helicase